MADDPLPDEELAHALVAEQFPRWRDLPIRRVEPGGHDNRTFRLGTRLSIRLPTADGYVAGERKEHEWLPRLAAQLPLLIPEIVGVGEPGPRFGRPWSIRRWIPGETAEPHRIVDPIGFARELGDFVVQLERADARNGPAAGEQSFHRGGDLSVYDSDTREALALVADELGARRAARASGIWRDALGSTWSSDPVWFHGDLAHGNLLLEDGALSAVIDFGTSGVGDPACDLVIVWTEFAGSARSAFLDTVGLDDATVARSQGWALWKALIVLAEHRETAPDLAAEARVTLAALLP